WTASRQGVLASNIANANTPGYQPRDVQSFQSLLAGQTGLEPARTQSGHLSGTLGSGLVGLQKAQPQARSIDGNGVALDQQLMKVADTETTQSLTTTIWKKYASFISLALGHS
ncbi:MAG: flagellar biosynthesis protein FlgB, partial [Rhodospirillales bacterium]|nr:flagellar biosynthesis protein FlgB [Acetobacter sp.]